MGIDFNFMGKIIFDVHPQIQLKNQNSVGFQLQSC